MLKIARWKQEVLLARGKLTMNLKELGIYVRPHAEMATPTIVLPPWCLMLSRLLKMSRLVDTIYAAARGCFQLSCYG